MNDLEEKNVGRTWYIPVTLTRRLKVAAAQNESTINDVVVAALRKHLDDQENACQDNACAFAGGVK